MFGAKVAFCRGVLLREMLLTSLSYLFLDFTTGGNRNCHNILCLYFYSLFPQVVEAHRKQVTRRNSSE